MAAHAAKSIDPDVIVVGLGPVGAVLAILLGQRGLRVLAIDREKDIYPLPRAAHFDHEIMRIFQQAGVADSVLEHTRVAGAYEFRSAEGDLLFKARNGGEESPSGWAYAYMFNQPGVERALRDRLAQLDSVDVRLGCAFADFEQTREGIVVQVDDGGVRRSVTASFLVGCDGAWSPVREAMKATLIDEEFDEPWLVVDAIPQDRSAAPTVNLQICDPARPTTCVMMGPGRHRWEFMMLPGETAAAVLADGFVERLLAPWNLDLTIERKAVYRFHGLVADRWRDGRVMIAGDAAHQTPPFAGQGMCSGIRDAANLEWKLAAVIRGDATEGLLESYQIEREPNVKAYIRLAIDMGKVVCTLDPQLAAARDDRMKAALASGMEPIAPAQPPPLGGTCIWTGSPGAGELFPQFPAAHGDGESRLDDALGEGPWLITHAASGAPTGAPGLGAWTTSDERLAAFRSSIEGWLADHNVDSVLVRPDRHVFGSGESAELVCRWAQCLLPSSVDQKAGSPS